MFAQRRQYAHTHTRRHTFTAVPHGADLQFPPAPAKCTHSRHSIRTHMCMRIHTYKYYKHVHGGTMCTLQNTTRRPTQPRHVLVHRRTHMQPICIDINIHYEVGHKFASRCQSASAHIAQWTTPLKLRPPDIVLAITNYHHPT